MATKKKGSKGRRRPPARPAAKTSPRPPSSQAAGSSKSPAGAAPKPEAASPSSPATKAVKAGADKSGAAKAGTAKAQRASTSRAARIEAAQRARRRKAILTRVAIVGLIVAVTATIAYVMVSNRQSKNRTIASMETGGCNYDEKADDDAGQGRNHIPNPTYKENPPSGGDHDVKAASAGEYSAESLPPDGQLVHSLEHGYVIIWYRPDIGEPALNELKAVTDKFEKDVLLVPRQSLPTPVAATAWHRRLQCEKPEPQALETFIESFRNEGPEDVPHP